MLRTALASAALLFLIVPKLMAADVSAASGGTCPSFGIFPALGLEALTIAGEAHHLTVYGGQIEIPNTCWKLSEQTLSLGGLLSGDYGVRKIHVPGISVKAGGLGPELCLRRKAGLGFCASVQGNLLMVKDGQTFIIGTAMPQASIEQRLGQSFVARLNASYASYSLVGVEKKHVSDLTVTASLGFCPL